MQNNWHVQQTDAQVNRNIIDNIRLKTQNGAKTPHINTHKRNEKTRPLLIQDNQISPGLDIRN